MDNNLMVTEIDEKLMSNIGGVMGKAMSEALCYIVGYVDEVKEIAISNKNNIKGINNTLKGINNDIEGVIKVSKGNSDSISVISRKIDTLENDDTNKFNIYKTQSKSRIFQLVGDSSSCRFILFYRPFIQKLNSDVSNSLKVANTKKIYVEDFKKAVELAKTWYPDKKYIRDKINEILKLSTKKKLTDLQQQKVNALSELLNEVGGEINAIEF